MGQSFIERVKTSPIFLVARVKQMFQHLLFICESVRFAYQMMARSIRSKNALLQRLTSTRQRIKRHHLSNNQMNFVFH